MTKKITINAKPAQEKPAPSVDEWVQNRSTDGTKRVTVDIPKSLHAQIRIDCFQRGVSMMDELRMILLEHYKRAPLG
jgi:hypothetical protein